MTKSSHGTGPNFILKPLKDKHRGGQVSIIIFCLFTSHRKPERQLQNVVFGTLVR